MERQSTKVVSWPVWASTIRSWRTGCQRGTPKNTETQTAAAVVLISGHQVIGSSDSKPEPTKLPAENGWEWMWRRVFKCVLLRANGRCYTHSRSFLSFGFFLHRNDTSARGSAEEDKAEDDLHSGKCLFLRVCGYTVWGFMGNFSHTGLHLFTSTCSVLLYSNDKALLKGNKGQKYLFLYGEGFKISDF